MKSLIFLIVLSGLFVQACDQGEKVPPDLKKATLVLRHMSSPKMLKRTAFWANNPKAKPSRFVEWYFSIYGLAVWPPTLSEWEMEFGDEPPGRTLLRPEGVKFFKDGPKQGSGRQVVLRANDEAGTLIAESYIDPSRDAVYISEWKFKM